MRFTIEIELKARWFGNHLRTNMKNTISTMQYLQLQSVTSKLPKWSMYKIFKKIRMYKNNVQEWSGRTGVCCVEDWTHNHNCINAQNTRPSIFIVAFSSCTAKCSTLRPQTNFIKVGFLRLLHTQPRQQKRLSPTFLQLCSIALAWPL